MGHIDDSFLVEYEYTACKRNVQDTVDTFQKLGFVIHPVKSVFIPTQEIEFLGFLLNSVFMTIRLPPTKAAHVHTTCQNLLLKTEMTIRETAQVIGLIVSSMLYFRFAVLVFKCMTRCAPEYLTSKLVRRSVVSARNTRNSQLLDIPLFRTASGQRTFQYRATSLWNELQPVLKLNPSVTAFKRSLRQKLLNDYFT